LHSMVKKIEQTSFIDYKISHQRQPRRRCFLKQMQEVIRWMEFEQSCIEKGVYKSNGLERRLPSLLFCALLSSE
ncbi:MAG: hypothetical protein ACP5QY_05020, partial [Candidatus Hydrogenedens sp.]